MDNYKYYMSSSIDQVKEYENTMDITDSEVREEIYSRTRPAIMEHIRKSEKVLNRVVRGFFDSPIHNHKMFEYLTGVSTLKANVQENLEAQVRLMEKYLIKKDSKYIEKLRALDSTVLTDYDGSLTIRHVDIMRWLADSLDRDGKALFLKDGEAVVTTGPFMKVIEVSNRY